MSKQKRIYTKYKMKVVNKVVHGGMTKDPPRREAEHQDKWPKSHMVKVGRRVTKRSALDWESRNGFQANAPD